MNFAIMLLVVIAIASVIGTILKQNEPYQNYIIKFGPFWHELYKMLGLYDVYSSAWFIIILAFLVISTSVCIYRNTPEIIRSMRRFREDIHERAIVNMPQNSRWESVLTPDEILKSLLPALQRIGYRTRLRQEEGCTTVAAMKGAGNRAGYLLTHIAIVIICLGGLMDGNLPLKIGTLSKNIKIETRDLPVSQIPAESKLSSDNSSFRASVSIPEGARINYAFINIADGYLLQTLPFSIEVRDFRIEHYDSGQPKSFESDLIITDQDTRETFEATIAVNHPLIYKKYAIYQSSFGDGGTSLNLLLRDLSGIQINPAEIKSNVNASAELDTPHGKLRIEFEDFRKFNIFPADENTKRKFTDYGPSLSFKVRNEDGTAKEYVNYMYPVYLDDRSYFLSGVRSSTSEELRYLYIPVDSNNSPDRFFRFLEVLHDDEKINLIINQAVQDSLQYNDNVDPALRENMGQAMLKILVLFRAGGVEGILDYVDENVHNGNRQISGQAYFKILQSALREIYIAVLREEGVNSEELGEEYQLFFDDAVNALNAVHHYGTPFYLQLKNYDHKEATGLQITRTPGKKFVYVGFGMLICGVFLLFYVSHQRLWIMLKPVASQNTQIIMAGNRIRHRRDFAEEFNKLSEKLKSAFG